jgi:hypothetical protein
MSRLDDDFLNELEGRIDETFKETQPNRWEVTGDHGEPAADDNEISNQGSPPGTHHDLDGENGAETVVFDLTEEELSSEKIQAASSEPGQSTVTGTPSGPRHPVEISTNVIVTRENAEFAVRKFVRDLKECLLLSKTISIRFEIKTLNDDNGRS